jgi:small-conductance mechanosensitive channel
MHHRTQWKRWLALVIPIFTFGILCFSCQTRKPVDKSQGPGADIQLLSRIGRASNRYRASMDLASYAQTAVERSLAERHWQLNRDILKQEFARVKLVIEEMKSQQAGGKETPAPPAAGAGKKYEEAAAEVWKVYADVELAKQKVAEAQLKRTVAKSTAAIERTQRELIQARQALEIAQKKVEVSEDNLNIAEQQQKKAGDSYDGIKSLAEKVALLEKEVLAKEGADLQVLKWGEPVTSPAVGLMGSFRYWWNLYDKGTVLDRAEQRTQRMAAELQETRSENQKNSEHLQAERLALNQQIQAIYSQANEWLKQPGQNERADRLLAEADAKMKERSSYQRRQERIGQEQIIIGQQLILVAEDADKLKSWDQVIADSRARAMNRLLQRLGSLLAVVLAVFLIAHFVKKIPGRFVSEQKSAYYFRKLIGFAAWLIVILIVIFNVAGDIGSLSAVVGLAGAGLAIALQDPIVSLVGWFLVVGKHGISVGDRIEINHVKGDVVDVGMLRIAVLEVGNWLSGEQSTGRMVFFPNSFIFKGHFFNYSTANSFIWDEVRILVTYESQWDRARDIILRVAEEASREVVERARKSQEKMSRRYHFNLGSPEPYAIVNIADSGVDLVLRYLTEIKLRRIMHDRICREILTAFKDEKEIELAYPTHRQLTETRILSGKSDGGNHGT